MIDFNIFIQDDHFSYSSNCYQHGSCVHNTKDSHNTGNFTPYSFRILLYYDLSDSVLSEADKIKFGDLFQSYRDVFAFTDDELGKTSLVQTVIDTGDELPIKQRPYRTSPKCKQEIDRQVKDMLQKGIIRESVSPWSSPVVLVKEKDGSFRFCVDLRKVNAVTRKDSFPMPLVSDTLDALVEWN